MLVKATINNDVTGYLLRGNQKFGFLRLLMGQTGAGESVLEDLWKEISNFISIRGVINDESFYTLRFGELRNLRRHNQPERHIIHL